MSETTETPNESHAATAAALLVFMLDLAGSAPVTSIVGGYYACPEPPATRSTRLLTTCYRERYQTIPRNYCFATARIFQSTLISLRGCTTHEPITSCHR